MDASSLKNLLLKNDPEFWAQLKLLTRTARDFEELFLLSSLRKKAHARKLLPSKPPKEKLRLAMLGGYSLYPLHEFIEHLCEVENFPVELWQGDYDNYISEIMDGDSELYSFAPQVVFLLPAERRCTYTGKLTNPHLKFHHFGLAVRRPDEARKFVIQLGYELGGFVFDPAQNVHLQLCTHASHPAVEIIWPGPTPGPVEKLTERHTSGIIYHLCYETDNLTAALAGLEQAGLNANCISPPTPAPLFGGRPVSFYRVAGIGLVEILELN